MEQIVTGEIWKFKKDIAFKISGFHKKGQRLYKEVDKDTKCPIWFPIDKHTYPICESDQFKWEEDDLEFIEKTDKPKSYYLDIVKAYTQEQLDKENTNY